LLLFVLNDVVYIDKMRLLLHIEAVHQVIDVEMLLLLQHLCVHRRELHELCVLALAHVQVEEIHDLLLCLRVYKLDISTELGLGVSILNHDVKCLAGVERQRCDICFVPW
jgi:hypothetical protein